MAARGAGAAAGFDSSPHWFSLTWWPAHDGGSGGLKEFGWIQGQNISVEYRFAEGKEDALQGIAAELVRLRGSGRRQGADPESSTFCQERRTASLIVLPRRSL